MLEVSNWCGNLLLNDTASFVTLVIEKHGKRTDYSAKVSSGGSAYSLDV